ncbi:TELO2-interacting protein 1 homolog [Mizuhopecten yessoensis]|uniref:TELO2-interacting protein 1-like n=1 Tax=Mizuhopecten yessoensis TaxID=6573 RepID=A0A210QD74_MIZYE|nr:TELO2-interacting protein 1 homolog [Mizuhopecten yessoensis]XP_021361065.1 TELO2-interacting protein 1 homolog [Mizuhopecten yessoensis]OWF46694.1 TELO2-interacting protein 1-like [Mizuhopecten yessoensis]
MSSDVKSGLFERLRPICVQLTREHTRENVTALFQAVTGLERKYMQELQEYVLFPLRIILKQEKKYSGELYVDIYQCMECVLSSSCVTRWDMFLDIFNTACMTLSDPTDPSKLSPISEELKLAIVQMLLSLLKSSDFNIIENLFAVGSLPVLGHAVSMLLNIADQERSRPLKIAALGFLMELCQEDRKYCTGMRVRLGDTLASFLPGVTITLSRVISCDTHQGQTVIQTALELLTKLMRLVLDDKLVAESQSKAKHQSHSTHAISKLESLVVRRSPDWLKSTGSKLDVIVKQVTKVRSHSSWKVRLSLVDWVGTMLLHCRGSLEESVADLLTVLVGRLGDDYPKVATHSRQNLDRFAASLDGKQCRPLVEMLEENLYSLSISLPRQMNTTDEEEKLFVVQLLVGYLELLGDQIDGLMLSHGRRLLMSLVQVLDMDYSDIRTVEERTTITGHGTSALNQDTSPNVLPLRKYFKHFHDDRVYKKLQRTCQCLGHYGNTQLLVDQVLDIAHLSAAYKPQAILMLNEIISGTAEKQSTHKPSSTDDWPDDRLKSVIRMLVEDYLSPGNFYLVTTAAETDTPHHQVSGSSLRAITQGSGEDSVGVYHRNTVLICLLLEGLGTFAKVLGKSYLPLLVQTLYPMLEKLGDNTAVISNAAYLSLCTTCTACNYSSIEELIQKNADYLVNAISLRLRHFHDNQHSPLVLKVMLQYSNCDLLPLIDDTIQEILDALDDHHLDQAMLFMGVLHELTKAIVRWFPPIKCEVTAKNSQYRSDKEGELGEGPEEGPLLPFIQHYCEQKRLASGEITEEDIVDDDIIDEMETIEDDHRGDNSEPNTVKFVKQVMMRCKHLLSSHNARLQLLVLDTISQACQALADHTNELLPLLHELWAPFSARFVDEEKLVIKKALEVLLVMADRSGDFLKQRVMKDVLPVVTNFLYKQAQISSQAGQAYLYTVNCRLQQQALQVLGSLTIQLDLAGNSLDSILSVCVSYLSSRQPKPLQQVTMEMCKQLAAIGGDVLWLRLSDLYRDQEYSPPHPIFSPLQFHCKVGCQNEFSDNIIKLRSSGNCKGT